MFDLLDAVYEFQRLASREPDLDETESARAVGLERLLRGSYAGGRSSRERAREQNPLPVQFTVPGGFARGQLHSLSSRGLAIASSAPPAEGLRVADPRRGVEYTFPGRVVWRRGKVLGIAFDGLPSRHAFLAPANAAWRRISFALRGEEPLVA
ncbi:MAG: PilZ domain-containing protein [Deltaproteobacteria bacterium]|nr:PilZ domain-containing protein [Deltaproteobacteria bacterium]